MVSGSLVDDCGIVTWYIYKDGQIEFWTRGEVFTADEMIEHIRGLYERAAGNNERNPS